MGKISEIFNFDNIGQKIKNLTKWSCWITILLIWIATPIVFIALVSDGNAYLCWVPIVSAIVGSIIVWIGSWTMYAFGEMVQRIINIDNNLLKGDQNSSVQRDSENRKICKLNELRAKGLITEDEYNRSVNQIF